MSRSSEYHSQRWKAQKLRQRAEQESRLAYTPSPYVSAGPSLAAPDATPFPLAPRGVADASFGYPALFACEVRESNYYQSLTTQLFGYDELIPEIVKTCHHVEPFEDEGKRPSPLFVLVLRLLELSLTREQVRSMLAHSAAHPYVRVAAVLFVRIGSEAEHLWEALEPQLGLGVSLRTREGAPVAFEYWIESLLRENRYYGILLPAIPAPELKRLTSSWKERSAETDGGARPISRAAAERIPVGTVVRAVWSEDKKLYEARVDAEAEETEGDGYWVTFLPEDEYGNQEFVASADIKLIPQPKRARVVAEPRAEEPRESA